MSASPPVRPPSAAWLAEDRLVALLLVLATVVTYAAAVAVGSFHFDDSHNLVENPAVRSLGNVPAFFTDPQTWSSIPGHVMYRPLQTLSYAADFALWEYRPAGWVLTNALLHAGAAVLTWKLARRLGLSPLAAALAGGVMALHPVHSEVVNYVSSRSESLAAVVLLLALHAHLAARGAAGLRRAGFAALALALSMSSLLAKETTALFFVAVAWMEVLLTPGGAAARLRRAAAFGVVYGAGLVAMLVLRSAMLGHATTSVPVFASPAGADAQGGGGLSVLDNLFKVQSRVVVLYLQILARPVQLNVDYDVLRSGDWSAAAVAALAIHAAVAAWALTEALRGRRLVPLCVAWFWLFLAPSVAYPLNVVMNEHRLYLPGIPVALLAGAALARAGELVAARRGSPAWTAVAAAPLLLFVPLCVERSLEWRSEIVLWQTAVERAPGSARAHMHLGAAWQEEHSNLRVRDDVSLLDRAIEEYRTAERLWPTWYDTQMNLGSAWFQRGSVTGDPADLEAAVAAYGRAASLVGPEGRRARYLQTQPLTLLGRYDEALAIVAATRAGDEANAALYDLAEANILRKRGDRAGAAAAMRRVIAAEEPKGEVDGLVTLGWWSFEDGDLAAARDLTDRAMSLSKRNAREGRPASFQPFLRAARMLVLLAYPGAESYVADARALGWSAPADEVRWVQGGPTPGIARGVRGVRPPGSPR